MLLFFSPILLVAFGLMIWAGSMAVAHARRGEPLGRKCLLVAFAGLVLLDIPICLYILLSAALGHSTDAGEVWGIKSLLSFVLVVLSPSAALLIYRYHSIQACAHQTDTRKAASKTKTMILVATFGLGAVCLWLFAAAGGWPLLLYTSRNRYDNASIFLIRHGININAVDRFGWTPLALYSARSSTPEVKLLVDRGADVNLAGKKGAPLVWAALVGNESIAGLLLDNGADANSSSLGRTPLMYAASRGNSEVVRLLIEHGADVNRHSPQGSALLQAVESKNYEAVAYLLESGANPNAKSASDRTPLMQAAGDGNTEMVKSLLKKGANPNFEAYDGKTALKMALAGGHAEVAHLIREYSAR